MLLYFNNNKISTLYKFNTLTIVSQVNYALVFKKKVSQEPVSLTWVTENIPVNFGFDWFCGFKNISNWVPHKYMT